LKSLRKPKDRYLRIKAHYDSGVAFLKNGRCMDAIFQFEKALALDPNYAGAMYYLAYCLRETGQLDKALHWAKEAIARMPSDADTHYLMGSIYSDQSGFEAAFESYRTALEHASDPSQMAMIYEALGYVYTQLGRRREAIETYEQVLRLAKDRKDVYELIGGLYLEESDFGRAMGYFEQCDPTNVIVQQNLAWALWQVGERARAISTLRTIIELTPNDCKSNSLLGYFLFEKKCFEEAAEILERAIDRCEEPDDAMYFLARCLEEIGQLDGALKIYESLLVKSPDDTSLLAGVGYVYLKQDNLEKAIDVWEKAVRMSPMSAAERATLAYGLYLKADLTAALEEVDYALELDPGYDIAHQRKGLILSALGDRASAVAELTKAVDLGQTEALLDLATVYRDLGDTDKARHCVEQFIQEAHTQRPGGLVNLSGYLEEAETMLRELE
jgi:FimV-like protein